MATSQCFKQSHEYFIFTSAIFSTEIIFLDFILPTFFAQALGVGGGGHVSSRESHFTSVFPAKEKKKVKE
jgi:hypothetical protein